LAKNRLPAALSKSKQKQAPQGIKTGKAKEERQAKAAREPSHPRVHKTALSVWHSYFSAGVSSSKMVIF